MHINVSPHHVELNCVFLKLNNNYIVTDSLVFIALKLFTLEKVKLEKKRQKQPFENNL